MAQQRRSFSAGQSSRSLGSHPWTENHQRTACV